VRTAEEPGQALNVDLCFVPATRTATTTKLPAVSGSSGRVQVERLPAADAERTYPGRVFTDPAVPYAEAMAAFVAASPPRLPPKAGELPPPERVCQAEAAEHRALRQEHAALQEQRRLLREQRQQEDAAWQRLREEHATVAINPFGDLTELLGQERIWAHELSWKALREQRRATLAHRREEDAAWREARDHLRERQRAGAAAPSWIAILVVTDNCSRQCLGLPLFEAGPKVTAGMIVQALRRLLPAELQFLITDRGAHFTGHEFAYLARTAEFVHVLIARHRPESNGIAERFVRTLKEWLADKTWDAAPELEALLASFEAEYNERPHQGVGLPGLSPNEFAKRIWLM
jgi:transposase InsO family protein